MNTNNLSLAHLSDDQLLVRVKVLVRQDRVTTARLITHLAEMEERKLYCREACSSLFTYCVEILHLSEPAAYRRVKAARLVKRFPVVLDLLWEGSIHLAALDVLAAHLTETNHAVVLGEARHKTKREVEELAARLCPLPDVPPAVRKLPEPQLGETGRAASAVPEGTITKSIFRTGTGEEAAEAPVGPRPGIGGSSRTPSVIVDPNPSHRPVIAPQAPARYRIQFTASAETYRKLRQVQELMRHRVPDGDPAAIMDTALTVLLEKLLRGKTGVAVRPRRRRARPPAPGEGRRDKTQGAESGEGRSGNPTASGTGEATGVTSPSEASEARRRRVAGGKPTESRHIPAAVKRAVWQRDQGRCAFTAKDGRRCSSRGPLEYHHIEPYMHGGTATSDNISLRCRAHNAHEGVLIFGERHARIPDKKVPNTQETLPGESCGHPRAPDVRSGDGGP